MTELMTKRERIRTNKNSYQEERTQPGTQNQILPRTLSTRQVKKPHAAK